MTAPKPQPALLDEALAGARHLLLDFDGVICQLYGARSDARAKAADRVRAVLTASGSPLTPEIAVTGDPAAVLAHAYDAGGDRALAADAVLTECELAAVPSAEPNAYVQDVIASARESGRRVTIVSTCAVRTVDAYLERISLTSLVGSAVTRTPDDRRSLSDLGLLARSTQLIDADPSACALVAARAPLLDAATEIGIAAIAYRRDGSGHDRSAVDAMVTSLADLVLRLRARPLRD